MESSSSIHLINSDLGIGQEKKSIKKRSRKKSPSTDHEVKQLLPDIALQNKEEAKKIAEKKFESLFKNYELLTTLNVEVDTSYHNRTSIITLILSLLLVGYQAMLPNLNESNMMVGVIIGVLGFILSVLWYFFEQRNCVYYTGRGQVLAMLEEKLENLKCEAGVEFQPFWTFVPKWVKENAKWHESFSAPFILRTLLPLLFSLTWIIIIYATTVVIKKKEKEAEKNNVITVKLLPSSSTNTKRAKMSDKNNLATISSQPKYKKDSVAKNDTIKINSKLYKLMPRK